MRTILVPLVATALSAFGQTGPGGVGNSTSNVLWLDANFSVTRSGTAVTAWNDRSGNGNNATPPSAAARPAFVAGSVNGFPSIDFDGTDDELRVPDVNSLDLTSWHFFFVPIVDLQKDYNAWIVKGDDGLENYEMLSYLDGNIHTPTYYTDATRTFPSSAGAQVNTSTFEVVEYSYSSAVGRDVYRNGATIITDNENKTPQTNARPLFIGNERSTTGRFVNGDLAEVIAFNAPLNSAQRIIVNNYLAAKYGRTLSASDLFLQDNPAQGNFDHDVAGIGRVDGSNMHTNSRGTGIVQVNKGAYTGLDNGEFLLWGHNNGTLGTSGISDFPTGVEGRWGRVWRVNEVNTSGTAVDVGNVDITFDLAGLGPVTTSHLRLLVDTDNDGVFADETPIGSAESAGGTLYRFNDISALVNGRRFTLATTNIALTPLPVEFIAFNAAREGSGTVMTTWSTASERGNDHFTVQRSLTTEHWEDVAVVDAAGNSNTVLEYAALDAAAPPGVCYYRIEQTDFDGTSSYTHIVAVDALDRVPMELEIAPNPSQGELTVSVNEDVAGPTALRIIDTAGRVVFEDRTTESIPDRVFRLPPMLANGRYTVLYEHVNGQHVGALILSR